MVKPRKIRKATRTGKKLKTRVIVPKKRPGYAVGLEKKGEEKFWRYYPNMPRGLAGRVVDRAAITLAAPIFAKLESRNEMISRYTHFANADAVKLKNHVVTHGTPERFQTLIDTVNGRKTAKTRFRVKLPGPLGGFGTIKAFKRSEKGIVDVLSDGMKFAKGKKAADAKTRKAHLDDIKTMIAQLETIKNSEGQTVGITKKEVLTKLIKYRNQFNSYHKKMKKLEKDKKATRRMRNPAGIKALRDEIKGQGKDLKKIHKARAKLEKSFKGNRYMRDFASEVSHLGFAREVNKSGLADMIKNTDEIDEFVKKIADAKLTKAQKEDLEIALGEKMEEGKELMEEARPIRAFISSAPGYPDDAGNYDFIHLRYPDSSSDIQTMSNNYKTRSANGLLWAGAETVLATGAAVLMGMKQRVTNLEATAPVDEKTITAQDESISHLEDTVDIKNKVIDDQANQLAANQTEIDALNAGETGVLPGEENPLIPPAQPDPETVQPPPVEDTSTSMGIVDGVKELAEKLPDEVKVGFGVGALAAGTAFLTLYTAIKDAEGRANDAKTRQLVRENVDLLLSDDMIKRGQVDGLPAGVLKANNPAYEQLRKRGHKAEILFGENGVTFWFKKKEENKLIAWAKKTFGKQT